MPRTNHNPPGFMSKVQAALRLGMSTKTLDRRLKTEPLLRDLIRKGKQIFIRETAVEAYYQHSQERGHL